MHWMIRSDAQSLVSVKIPHTKAKVKLLDMLHRRIARGNMSPTYWYNVNKDMTNCGRCGTPKPRRAWWCARGKSTIGVISGEVCMISRCSADDGDRRRFPRPLTSDSE